MTAPFVRSGLAFKLPCHSGGIRKSRGYSPVVAGIPSRCCGAVVGASNSFVHTVCLRLLGTVHTYNGVLRKKCLHLINCAFHRIDCNYLLLLYSCCYVSTSLNRRCIWLKPSIVCMWFLRAMVHTRCYGVSSVVAESSPLSR